MPSERRRKSSRRAAPPPRAPSSVRRRAVNELVGRDAELATLRAHLDGPARVVVVTGPNGIGKTRLVTEALRHRAHVAVDLSDVRAAEGLTSRIASAIDVVLASARSDADRVRQLGRALADVAEGVLVLDGADAVRAPLSKALDALSELAPEKRFVVTTREALPPSASSRRAAALEVGPLSTEPVGDVPSDAARLFVARCEVRGNRARLSADDPALTELVRALGGVPLALDLAAARFERGGVRALAVPPTARSEAMQASVAWSFASLQETEQRALEELAVFEGSFTADAAEAVLALPVDTPSDVILGALEEASLITRSTFDDAVERFHLEESVRTFARERLGERVDEAACALRHDDHFLALGRSLASRVEAFGDIHARAQLASELSSLLAVHARSLSNGDTTRALDALLALDAVLATQVSAQVRLDLWSDLEARLGADTPRALDVLAGMGRALAGVGRLAEARALLQDAAARAERGAVERAAHLYIDLGLVDQAMGALGPAREAYARALEIEARCPDERLRARAWGNLGAVLHDERKLDGARRNYARSLAYAQQVGDARIEGIMLTNLGVLEQELGEHDRARASLDGALRLLEPAGDRRLTAIARGNLSTLLLECGDLAGARIHGEAALAEQRAMGDLKSLALVRSRMVALFALLGDGERARVELAEARRIAVETEDASVGDLLDVVACFIPLTEGAEPAAVVDAVRAVTVAPSSSGVARGDRSDEVRTMLRVAEAITARAIHAPPSDAGALLVARDVVAFRPPIASRAAPWVATPEGPARRVLAALVRLRVERSESGLSMEEIAEVAWPEEVVPSGVRASRVYALVGSLRQLGLDGVLLRRPGGYLLDPDVPVLAGEDPPGEITEPPRRRKR